MIFSWSNTTNLRVNKAIKRGNGIFDTNPTVVISHLNILKYKYFNVSHRHLLVVEPE